MQTVTLTIPAFIRVLEIGREDIKEDTDLHEFVETLLNKSGNKTITSDMLEDIKGDGDNDEDDVNESKHRILVTVTDPHSEYASNRNEKQQKFLRLPVSDKHPNSEEGKDAAKLYAVSHYKKLGYKVHGKAEHTGIINEMEVNELDKETLKSYVSKAEVDAKAHGKKAERSGNPVKSYKEFRKATQRYEGIRDAKKRIFKKEWDEKIGS